VFDNLSEKLGGILDRLTRRGSLTEADVDAAMREVRRALAGGRRLARRGPQFYRTGSANRRSAPPSSSR